MDNLTICTVLKWLTPYVQEQSIANQNSTLNYRSPQLPPSSLSFLSSGTSPMPFHNRPRALEKAGMLSPLSVGRERWREAVILMKLQNAFSKPPMCLSWHKLPPLVDLIWCALPGYSCCNSLPGWSKQSCGSKSILALLESIYCNLLCTV